MLEKFLAFQYIHNASSVFVPVDPVGKIKLRFAEEDVSAFVLKFQQCALDCTDALGRNVSVGEFIFLRVVAHILRHRPEILEVGKEESFIVRNAENDSEHAVLNGSKLQKP